MSTDTRFWHPFADMAAVRHNPTTIVRGEGTTVWDDQGAAYFDATASLWCVNVGHGRTEIVDAVAAQMRDLASYSAFGAFTNRPAEELTARLAGYAAPAIDDARIFLCLGGGDAIDSAAKLTRRYFGQIGQPDRMHLIGRTQGYHGTHGLGTSIGGIAANQAGMGPMDAQTSHVQHDSIEALAAEFDRVGHDRVAAVFVEPVIGAGGVHQPVPGYLEAVQELCRRHGALLVIDAVIGAFGRLGTWFAADRFGLRPDMITFAKGVTSGYLPLGGVVVAPQVAAPFWEPSDAPVWFRHGQTYSGHPTSCAAALANLDIFEREGLLERGMGLERDIAELFGALAGHHERIGAIRAGTGALGAVAFTPEALAERPDLPLRTFAEAKARGVLVRPLGDAVAISPPLIATREQIDAAGAAIGEAIAAVAASA